MQRVAALMLQRLSRQERSFATNVSQKKVPDEFRKKISKAKRKIDERDVRDLDERLLPVVAIVGKPNVGKSALFNRFLQRALALVKDTPDDHVTRDYKKGRGKLGDLYFQVIDTSGLEPFMAKGSIQERATQLTKTVLQQADATIYLTDARSGLTEVDHQVTRWLVEQVRVPIVLAANKAERMRSAGSGVEDMLSEATRLGLGEPVAISAETGEGMVDLYGELQPILDPVAEQRREAVEREDAAEADDVKQDRIAVAVVGVPNAGKSTLMNQLVGRERSLTGPEPGLTRDSVTDTLVFRGHPVAITDTAGWLDHSRMKFSELGGKLAQSAQELTERSYNRAHVVLLVIDATRVPSSGGMTRREVALATNVVGEGRALVVALNKLDALEDLQRLEVEAKIETQLQAQLPEVRGATCLGMSALTGQGLDGVLPAVVESYGVWNQRIPTAKLNKWLVKVAEKSGLEGGSANQVSRVRYVTQASSRPPAFVAFVSGTQPFTEASTKFLGNALRQEFGFDGVPLRMNIRIRKAEKGQQGQAGKRDKSGLKKLGRRWGTRGKNSPKRMQAKSTSKPG